MDFIEISDRKFSGGFSARKPSGIELQKIKKKLSQKFEGNFRLIFKTFRREKFSKSKKNVRISAGKVSKFPIGILKSKLNSKIKSGFFSEFSSGFFLGQKFLQKFWD